MDSNHRRHCQQIYSLSPLATREFPHMNLCGLLRWSWWTDSNPRPADYKSAALPAELHQHLTGLIIIANEHAFVNNNFSKQAKKFTRPCARGKCRPYAAHREKCAKKEVTLGRTLKLSTAAKGHFSEFLVSSIMVTSLSADFKQRHCLSTGHYQTALLFPIGISQARSTLCALSSCIF